MFNQQSKSLWICLVVVGIAGLSRAAALTPADLTSPYAVQPNGGVGINSGVSDPFFSALNNPPFSAGQIVDVLGNLQAFDSLGSPLSNFQVTGVTVIQGSSSFILPVSMFLALSPTTFTDSVNSQSAVLGSSGTHVAFLFDSDATLSYSFTINATGIPDGGFLLFDDVEAAQASVPEPSGLPVVALAIVAIVRFSRRRARLN